MKFFNVIKFIKSKASGGDKKLFNLLNKKQMGDKKKIKFCDHVVQNDKNLVILKKKLSSIISKYE